MERMVIMNPFNLFWLFTSPAKGWSRLVYSKPSIPRLYLAHVIPFSLMPPLMVYFAGSKYGGHLIQILSGEKLLLAATILFVVELVVVPVMAMTAAVGLIYYGIPVVFRLKEKGHAILMFGAVLTAGVVAWVFIMVSTLVILGSVQNLQFAMPPL
jgi:hypothetical protein